MKNPRNKTMHPSPAEISLAKKVIAEYVLRVKPKGILLVCRPDAIEHACEKILTEA